MRIIDTGFWLDKWKTGQIGFHQPDGHPALPEFWSRLKPVTGERVLVPLCGKARDLAWLAERGHVVHGIELSEAAAAQFFVESRTEPAIEGHAGHSRYRVRWHQSGEAIGEVIIDVGDFFDLPSANELGFDLYFDRAALIALPATVRPRYVARVAKYLASGARGLVVTLEYPTGSLSRPPYPIDLDEVVDLFADDFEVAHAATRDVLYDYPGFASQGLPWLVEHVLIVKTR